MTVVNKLHLEREVKPFSVEPLLRPNSIAIVGISSKKGSAGAAVLQNIKNFQYKGKVYLVSRNNKEIEGEPCVPTIDDLPKGIDLVVLCIPRDGIVEAVEACVRREAKAVIIFASGFAETGEAGQRDQQKIRQLALENGLIVAGPNMIGLLNNIDGICITMGRNSNYSPFVGPHGVGIIAQSGGMMANIRIASEHRDIPVSYAISTGNEALVGVEDYLAFLIEDEQTRVITLFAEQIRRPQLFLKLVRKAREKGKPIILLHTGRSEKSRESAKSHTGAMTGDYAIIETLLKHEAVIMVDSLDELYDVTYLLTRYPNPSPNGLGLITDSGAFKGFAIDYCEALGIQLPELTNECKSKLSEILPPFASLDNPLDLTAQGMAHMDIYGRSAEVLLDETEIGSLVISLMPGTSLEKARSLLPVLKQSTKPMAYAIMGGDSPLPDQAIREIKESGIPFFRSPERALTAMARLIQYAQQLSKIEDYSHTKKDLSPALSSNIVLQPGVLPEYRGKELLADLGITIPEGGLVKTYDEANELAHKIGYPVVLKIQSSQLAHKSEIGGVIVNIKDENELQNAWQELEKKSQPFNIDGFLLEKMAPPGLEMVVGARRESQWGPVVMVGLGGIWVEVLQDYKLLPPDLDKNLIVDEILSLKSAKLLTGARGRPPADIEALADVVAKIGEIMICKDDILEIDINPLIVYPQGHGISALDALIVVKDN